MEKLGIAGHLRRLREVGVGDLLQSVLDDAGTGHADVDDAVRFADAVENLPAPLRVELDFQSNVRRGLMCVDVRLPGPACLSFAADAPEARARAARLHAELYVAGAKDDERGDLS